MPLESHSTLDTGCAAAQLSKASYRPAEAGVGTQEVRDSSDIEIVPHAHHHPRGNDLEATRRRYPSEIHRYEVGRLPERQRRAIESLAPVREPPQRNAGPS